MNCFAGGVFLAMAFIHILPEAVEQYYGFMTGEEHSHAGHRLLKTSAANATLTAKGEIEEEKHVDRHGIFPLPYLLFFVGYCLVLLVDRVFAGEHGHSHAHGGQHDHHHHDHEDVDEKAKTNAKLTFDNEKDGQKISGGNPTSQEGPVI
jgi:zinc transporter ZupT